MKDSRAADQISRSIDLNFDRIFTRIDEVQSEHNIPDEELDVWLKNTWGDDLADAYIEWRENGE